MSVTDSRREDGFTLVELLVVILLLGVVGSVVTAGLVSAMGHTRDSQERIHAMAELQRSAERITREMRAACPVMAIDDDDVTVAIQRGGETVYHQFYRDADDRLRHAVKENSDDAPDGGNVLITDLPDDGEALFTFLGDSGAVVTDARDVRIVRMSLRSELPAQDHTVEVETTTSLRNGGRSCD
jgi:prepilin-type N-terminal cleavage/methylation domain-containing protein